MTPPAKPKPLTIAGIMSGTSADGIDVALVRLTPTPDPAKPKLKLLGYAHFPYNKATRAAVLAAMDAPAIATADLARLHTRLGQLYGEAVLQTQAQLQTKAHLIGLHGQTIYHQTTPTKYLGKPIRCTLQLGEAAETAALTGLPVLSDFRPADLAHGGEGAPLVPILDRALYTHPTRNRILQNLGGIANLTALTAASEALLAFDTGPANVLIDLAMQRLYHKPYDRNGTTAARGTIIAPALQKALQHPYFAKPAPKSCGREQFNNAFLDQLITICRKHSTNNADILATATALTAQSILHAHQTFVAPFLAQHAPKARNTDYIVAGGGTENATLMRHLRHALEPLGLTLQISDDLGLPSQAKEAVAFALLAWLRWHHLPGNLPAATGASRPCLLGKITLP